MRPGERGLEQSEMHEHLANTITQDRPCQRCVKRSIGHLCHDEPRESPKVQKSSKENGESPSDIPLKQEMLGSSMLDQTLDQQGLESQLSQGQGGQSAPLQVPTPSNASLDRQQMQSPPVSSGPNGAYPGNNPPCE